MKLVERFWTTVTVVVNWFTLSPFNVPDGTQFAITTKIDTIHTAENIRIQNLYNIDPTLEYEISSNGHGPIFRPPTGRPKGLPGSELKCEYPSLGPDWIPCSTAANRECWLRNTKTGEQYNITTDYENAAIKPPGVVRDYTLVLSNKTINADGIPFPYAKVFSTNFTQGENFDGTFPGPWIQACWGDILNVTVYNELPYTGVNSNGTSIHWHGLRQWNTMQFDGVNGITQCPIAPRDNFTYTFDVLQYGSTWYHSHYSMQYADGTQGPLTLHGPTSSPFDDPLYPLIITDWGHNSAFQATYPIGLKDPSIVLNGRGNITRFLGIANTADIPDIYQVTFEPSKRYLMRIINTAFETGFTFSIDGHEFDVVENDLVPIKPYTVNSIVVHIGQRYNIVVQAKNESQIGDGNFWIRTTTCYTDSINPGPGLTDWMKTGIVRYNNESTDDPTDRTSRAWPSAQNCDDEPLDNIHPKHEWTVGQSKNSIIQGENVALGFPSKATYIHASLLWNVKDTMSSSKESFQIQYNDPIFLRLADPKPRPEEVVIYSSDNFTANDWAYIVIDGAGGHPIHLHGHDFAVVYQSTKSFSPDDIKSTCPDNPDFNCDNPARRDVIMPHGFTYVVIAFKTDNPGSWLMHCHIAAHAGAGLDLQILERPQDAAAMWPPGSPPFVEAQRVCGNFEDWWTKIQIVQDDSGV